MFHGMGIGLVLVSTFSDALKTAIQSGFTEGLDTYGLVSGLWTSIFAFGAFIGPTASGVLYDAIGFRESVYFIIVWQVLVAIVFILFLLCSRKRPKMYKEISPNESIVRKSGDDIISDRFDRSRQSSFSSTHHVPIPIERGCAMNTLIMATSFGTKTNHWQRLEESNMGLLQDPNRDDLNDYGSFDVDFDPHRGTIA